jgi:hypothetical protein
MTALDEKTAGDAAHEILDRIDKAWSSPIVLRKDIEKFSCGLTTHRSMEVADQKGLGISNRIQINGKVAYTKENALKWFYGKIKSPQTEGEKKRAHRPHKNDILLEARKK